jgi:hypothetical protein
MVTENLYFQKKAYWLKFFRSILDNKKVQQTVLRKYLNPEKVPGLKSKIQQQFETLLPQIPDFGRKKLSPLYVDMVKTALSLAFFRVLAGDGFQLREIGQIMYEIAEVFYGSQNPLKKYLARRYYSSPSIHKKIKTALERRKNVDPEDYHCAFVEGDQENLLFGINYTNCGGLHFLRHQNALEIAPYLCLCDYPMFRGFKIGFNRTQNLAIGGQMCSFRFYRDYPTPKGWPPEELSEYRGFKFDK